jgi:hypothetical protein
MEAGARPPRYFWRRTFATFADVLLASLLSALILLPFLGNTDQIRLDQSLVFVNRCQPVTNITQEAADLIAPEKPTAAIACKSSVLGIDNGLTLQLIYGVTQTENTHSQRTISVPIDNNGKPIIPMMPQSFIETILLVAVGGWLLRSGRQTPGKRLLGLRVENAHAHPFLREAMKYIYSIFTASFMLLSWVWGDALLQSLGTTSLTTLIGVAVLFGIAAFAYYLLPILRWRGAMPWDRYCGSTVQRKR